MSISQLPRRRAAAAVAGEGAAPAAKEARASLKGQQTKAAIVDAALRLASRLGLEGLSIGAVAEIMQMSKSGVFAHFGAREELQISVVREHFHRFEQEVFMPVLALPRGLPRVEALFANWMKRVAFEIESGCIFISGAVAFDDQPGPVRDALAESVNTWLDAYRRAVSLARDEGHLRADVDIDQMVYEIHGLILALHYEARFLKKPGSIARAHAGFAHVLSTYGTAPASAAAAGAPARGG